MRNRQSEKTAGFSKLNKKLRIAIVRSNYYRDLTQNMEISCRKNLISCGVKEINIETFEVPGSWEIPITARKNAQSRKFDGIVTLGIIIKGDTYHFELIADTCAKALMDISLNFNIPISFEVLAVYNLKQAKERGLGKSNKGLEAAQALLQTIEVLRKI